MRTRQMLRLARATLWFLLMGVGLPQGRVIEGACRGLWKGFFYLVLFFYSFCYFTDSIKNEIPPGLWQ